MTRSNANLPGFGSPAAGFEAPFDLLGACHERVLRTLDLLERLIAHVDAHGHDAATRVAAGDVLRYFELAAPKHHEDEERHVFPALLACDDVRLRTVVARLQAEHRRFNADWPVLRDALARWRDEPDAGPIEPGVRDLAHGFIEMNRAHVSLEEEQAYPAARPLFAPATLAQMGAEMQARRRG